MKRKTVKEIAVIKPTQHNKGLRMPVEVRLYDNGILTINGLPMNHDKADTALASTIGVFADLMIQLKLQSTERARNAA